MVWNSALRKPKFIKCKFHICNQKFNFNNYISLKRMFNISVDVLEHQKSTYTTFFLKFISEIMLKYLRTTQKIRIFCYFSSLNRILGLKIFLKSSKLFTKILVVGTIFLESRFNCTIIFLAPDPHPNQRWTFKDLFNQDLLQSI